jgi:hypothetical protein
MLRSFLLVVIAVSVFPIGAEAARLVWIKIDLDGKPLFESGTADSGYPPPAAVWRYLTSAPLAPAQGIIVTAEPANPLQATLSGKIHIDVQYGGKADVSELHLVRRAANVAWTVAEEDVERIAQSIGLGTVPVVVPPLAEKVHTVIADVSVAPVWLWVGGGLVLLVMLAAIVILMRRGQAAV